MAPALSLIRAVMPEPDTATFDRSETGGSETGSADGSVTHGSAPTGAADATSAVAATPARSSVAARLNWLRAGVLGANDGIVSVAAVVLGVAGASSAVKPLILAGLAALIGGAFSMALGEYVSVSSQRDALKARAARGHVDDPDDASPFAAAFASLISFIAGGIIPFLVIVLCPAQVRVVATFVVVLVALGLTGALGAKLGEAPWGKAAVRVMVGGAIALAITYGLGALLGVAVG